MLNLAFLILVCLAYPIEGAHFITPAALRAAESDAYPQKAMRYLDGHSLPANVFAPYTWGGYIVWKSGLRYSDFIDGRANTLFDTRLLNDYLLAYNAQPEWSQVLSKYRVGTVMIQPSSPLAAALEHDSSWRLAYQDGQAAIFRRTA
jgi:hypothetical protein